MMQCWAFSTKKLIKSVGYIFVAADPTAALTFSAAVIVCRAGQNDSRNNNMMIVLRCLVDKVNPI